ncbi:MAG: hypothetical protein KKH67_00950 [candidate division Zixibacteria bacterium]|nr:hypothetical protein [candidate division Zixibacteria bacterium]MBU1471307.1 hypothetical protein [candidate division Zixibacteria bacterium]
MASHKLLKLLCLRKPGFIMTASRMRELIPVAIVGDTDLPGALDHIRPMLDAGAYEDGEFLLCSSSLALFVRKKLTVGGDSTDFVEFYYKWCKSNSDTAIGHRYVNQYAFDLPAYKDIIDRIDLDFIDRAVIRLFPRQDILSNVRIGIEAAYRTCDIVQLTRLGLLNTYTYQRFENIDEVDLVRCPAFRRKGGNVEALLEYEHQFELPAPRLTDLLLECVRLNVPLNFDSIIDKLKKHIVDLDADSRGEINYANYVKLMVATGHGTQYLQNVIVAQTANESAHVNEFYYTTFIDALSEFATSGYVKELIVLENFSPHNAAMRQALICALKREGATDEAHRIWEDFATAYSPKDTKVLLQGCELRVDPILLDALIDPVATIIEAPDLYHVSDEYIDQLLTAFSGVSVLAYLDLKQDLINAKASIQQLPKSYLKELLIVAFEISVAKGKHHSDRPIILDPSLIMRLIEYKMTGDEKPRVLDVVLTSQLGDLVCSLIEDLAILVSDDLMPEFLLSLGIFYENRYWHGYDHAFPETNKLLRAINRFCNRIDCSQYSRELAEMTDSIERDTIENEGYEGLRTSCLLSVAALWESVGNTEQADAVFESALRESHSYGFHKDITFNLLVRSLHYQNQVEVEGALERIRELADKALFLDWLTDWKEVRAVMPDLCDELALLKPESAAVLLGIFEREGHRHHYDECLRSFIEYCPANYALRYAILETIVEVQNVYNELIELYALMLKVARQAFDYGEKEVARLLTERARVFLTRDVAAAERGKLVSAYNQLALACGAEVITDIPILPPESEAHLPQHVTLLGNTIDFAEFCNQVAEADIEQLSEMWQSLTTSDYSYTAQGKIFKRIIELIESAQTAERLLDIEGLCESLALGNEDSEMLWAFALKWKEISNIEKFLIYGKRTCEFERSWGHVFTENNGERLAQVAKFDRDWTEHFVLQNLYDNSLKGMYTTWAVPMIQSFDIASGNHGRVQEMWCVFFEFFATLFRHTPSTRSHFAGILQLPGKTETELLVDTLLGRLQSDEYEVKHRTGAILAEMIEENPGFAEYFVLLLETGTHHSSRILVAAVLEYAVHQGVVNLQPHSERLLNVYRGEKSFYLRISYRIYSQRWGRRCPE